MTKTLLLLGSGPGLADAVTRRFGEAGWRVVLAARNKARLEDQADAYRRKGLSIETRLVDATDFGAIRRLVADVEKAFGGIDVFNYNAAVIRKATILEQPTETFASDLMTNVAGAMAAVQAVLPGMIARKGGTILLSGGGLAVDPWPDYLALSVGKAGLRALGQGLAKDPALTDVHIAHVTLHAQITPDAASNIATLYWALVNEPRGAWRTDVMFPE